VNSREASERVDAEPGVVGERVQPGEPRIRRRLLCRILVKRAAVLHHLGKRTFQVLRGDHPDVEPRYEPAQLAQLARVGRSEQKHEHATP
jgi:hypothetical protein